MHAFHYHRPANSKDAVSLGSQRQQDERIVLGFLDHESVVADLFQEARVAGDGMEIEWYFGRAQTGVDLAQRQQCFKQHVVTPR